MIIIALVIVAGAFLSLAISLAGLIALPFVLEAHNKEREKNMTAEEYKALRIWDISQG